MKVIRSSPFIIVYIILIMTLFSVAGCGSLVNHSESNVAASSQAQAPTQAVVLTLSAAASLTDALKEIQTAYEAKASNIKLSFNFGASGALQKQIEQGAPADLFLSASVSNMQSLVDQQLINAAQTARILTNELVVVVPIGQKLAIGTLPDLLQPEVKHVAVGIPESVPAGSYAKEALMKMNLWNGLRTKTVQGKDVRQVLQYIETGNAEAGFVYRTDALTSKKVTVAFSVDPQSYPTAEYQIGIVKASKHLKEAEALYQYLQGDEALQLFKKFGFSMPNPH